MIFLLVLPQINSTHSFLSDDKFSHSNQVNSNNDNTVVIKVAIYTNEDESDEDFYSQFRRTRYFIYALRDYVWQVQDITYRFDVDLISTKELYLGKLNIRNYDVMIYPPDMTDEKISQGLSKFQIRNLMERMFINIFIRRGGGFLGMCAGGIVAGIDIKKPDSLYERVFNSLDLGISTVNVEYDGDSLPLIAELAGKEADAIGPLSAYLWYSGWNQSNYSVNFHSGVCLDVPINRNNPIFDDYHQSTRRIRWIGGPPYIVPDNAERSIDILATFPKKEISENESTNIHYWDYKGKLRGLIKGMLTPGDWYYFLQFGPFLNAYCFAGDWEKRLDKPVKTNFSNKPFMTTEIFPNKNKARIVRSTGHLEHNVWWGGYMEEVKDTADNCQYEGFYRWKDVIPEEQTVENEFSYNYWIIRRIIAWSSQKLSNNHLPPTYGPSEVCEPNSYVVPSTFELIGSTEPADGIVTLDLYYRFSTDNSSWSEWKYHSSDSYESDGWSWLIDASEADGIGYYQFYSVRRVDYENHYDIEQKATDEDVSIYVK